MANKVMVLVPNSIVEVLRRNRLPLDSILDYTKLRGLVSVQDISAFLSLQRTDKIDLVKSTYNSYLLTSWKQNRSNDERAELDSVVVSLSYSEATVKELYESLADKFIEEPMDGKARDPYEIIDITREAFAVVIKPGFLTLQKSNKDHLDLLRKVLKVFYEYQQPHEVASLAIYNLYLRLLEDTN